MVPHIAADKCRLRLIYASHLWRLPFIIAIVKNKRFALPVGRTIIVPNLSSSILFKCEPPPLSRIHIFSWTEFILLKNYTRLRAQEFPSRQCRHCFGNVWNSQLGFLLNWIFEENWLASSNRRLVINQKDQWRDLTCVTRAPMRRFSNVKSNFLV